MKETALRKYLMQFGRIPLPEGSITWLQNTLVCIPNHIKVDESKEDAQIAGTILGRISKNEFHPAFPLIDYIAQHTTQCIHIDDAMAYLFTCGRDIFGKSVEVKPKGKGKYFIVKNEREEVLGVVYDDKLKGIFRNVLDRGIYLRQEMSKKKKKQKK